MRDFSKEAKAKFPLTIAQADAGEDYVHCPDCSGAGQIYAYRECEDHGSGEYFGCPLCHHTKLADRDDAIAFIRRWEESEGVEP